MAVLARPGGIIEYKNLSSKAVLDGTLWEL